MKTEPMKERLAALSPEKRRILERMIAERRKSEEQAHTIRKREPIGLIPLSFSQQRLWFLDQLQPGSTTYNMPGAVRLRGPLHVSVVQKSLDEVIRRHEILRTTFPLVDGRPSQVIAAPEPLEMNIVDVSELTLDTSETVIQHFIDGESLRTFDLVHGPLLHVSLLRLDGEDHLLHVIMHHIISDAWSVNLFIQELAILYEAFLKGKFGVLPGLPIQYADFAVWQRNPAQKEALDRHLAFWKKQLEGTLPVLQLPMDRFSTQDEITIGAQHSVFLPKALVDALNTLSQSEEVTLFMVMLSAFNILLYRYTNQEDLIVAAPVAGRNFLGTETLIGCFLNLLPLRVDLSGTPSFRELLQQVRQVVLDAYTHQDLPFEKIVEEIQPVRNLHHNPLTDVMLNFINIPSTPVTFPDIQHSFLDLTEAEPKFSLALYVTEGQHGTLKLSLQYKQNFFASERIAYFLAQFQFLLEGIVASPDRSIQAYSLVTPLSLPVLCDPKAALHEPYYEPIPSTFMFCAKQWPLQPAIRQGDCTWTYQELAACAHDIAGFLVIQGVKVGDVVAVSGSRSFGLIACMIGVLQCGGVLLSISQNLPLARKQLMLCEADATLLLLVDSDLAPEIWTQSSPSLATWQVDSRNGSIVNATVNANYEDIQFDNLSPESPAYIFFTSGSTGKPKGVLGCHKGLSHFLSWQRQELAIGIRDRVAQLTDLSFDVVLRDIFLPLTSGATLCLPTNEFGPGVILPWLEQERITLLHIVPSLAQAWLAHVPETVSLRTLRWVCFAGEPLTDTLVQRWRSTFSEAGSIVNLYGPTETTLAKCFYLVPPAPRSGIQPVGKPLPETQALVLTNRRLLCGISEIGEIALRTPFRCLRYINALEDNQQRFVINPFRNDEHDILYFTGDQGRYLPDGSVEILGRIDQQVKIRGVRVEPGELETLLSASLGVDKAVVIALDNGENKRLVVYVVCNSSQGDMMIELRRLVKETLPSYMMPSAFIKLDRIPLTANGKIDYAALPHPGSVRPTLEVTYAAPQNAVEQTVANIWREVLHLDRIGIHDNFFELGGHSLLLIEVQSQLQKELKRDIPLIDFFKYPTINTLTKSLALNQQEVAPVMKSQNRAQKRREFMKQRRGV